MAKLNEIRFFLLVSLMIFPSRALEVFLGNFNGSYNIHVEIEVDSINQARVYRVGPHETYEAHKLTDSLLLYITSPTRFDRVMNSALDGDRRNIAAQLLNGRFKYELLYMAIKDFHDNYDEPIIRDFIRHTIKLHKAAVHGTYDCKIIGRSLQPSWSTAEDFTQYIEIPQVFDGQLQKCLDSL